MAVHEVTASDGLAVADIEAKPPQPTEPPYDDLPERYREEARAYLERGKLPGPVLHATLCGDIYWALRQCEATGAPNIDVLILAVWFRTHTLFGIYGAPDTVLSHRQRGGLLGHPPGTDALK